MCARNPGQCFNPNVNAGYDGEVELNWQAAEQAFKQTWGELDAAGLSPAEALEEVSTCPFASRQCPWQLAVTLSLMMVCILWHTVTKTAFCMSQEASQPIQRALL